MRKHPTGRSGITTGVSVALMLIILILAGSASYLAFSQGTAGPSTTSSTTDSVTTFYPSNTTSSSLTSTTSSLSTSSSSSSSSTSSSSSLSSTSTTSLTDSTSSVLLNSSQVQVIIPEGIENIANKISFEPINITVVIGVNNTIVFANHDDQEHILESTSWPQGGTPFQFYSLPGQNNVLTLTTPGKYTYFCEWHPIWMDGTITVIA